MKNKIGSIVSALLILSGLATVIVAAWPTPAPVAAVDSSPVLSGRPHGLPECPTEDSAGCIWDDNDTHHAAPGGLSFWVDLNGHAHPLY